MAAQIWDNLSTADAPPSSDGLGTQDLRARGAQGYRASLKLRFALGGTLAESCQGCFCLRASALRLTSLAIKGWGNAAASQRQKELRTRWVHALQGGHTLQHLHCNTCCAESSNCMVSQVPVYTHGHRSPCTSLAWMLFSGLHALS